MKTVDALRMPKIPRSLLEGISALSEEELETLEEFIHELIIVKDPPERRVTFSPIKKSDPGFIPMVRGVKKALGKSLKESAKLLAQGEIITKGFDQYYEIDRLLDIRYMTVTHL